MHSGRLLETIHNDLVLDTNGPIDGSAMLEAAADAGGANQLFACL